VSERRVGSSLPSRPTPASKLRILKYDIPDRSKLASNILSFQSAITPASPIFLNSKKMKILERNAPKTKNALTMGAQKQPCFFFSYTPIPILVLILLQPS